MIEAGAFEEADVCLNIHPFGHSMKSGFTTALDSWVIDFYGKSAHAAGAPDKGRSALDAVEAFDYMMNLMREHVPSDSRIHYVITAGGKAPNVVPDFAQVV